MPRFPKGTSGNPRGRPPGVANQRRLRDAIAKDLPAIIDTLVEAARGGDVQAARTLLAKALPDLKATDQPVILPLATDSLADAAKSILQAVGEGQITPGEANALGAVLSHASKTIEVSELVERIERLEASSGNRN